MLRWPPIEARRPPESVRRPHNFSVPFEMQNDALTGTHVLCRASDGADLLGTPLRLDRHAIVFETVGHGTVLRVSEVLNDFKIVVLERAVFSGRAVIRNVIDGGTVLTCEANLGDGWLDLGSTTGKAPADQPRDDYRRLIGQWQKFYRVAPEFKVVVADLHVFLTELRMLCDQVEVELSLVPEAERAARERQLGEELSAASHPVLDGLFEAFEGIAAHIPGELQPAHQHFIRRQLHPTVLASPFAARVVRKPLGYAGDYEMVNMILRDPHEGPSLFGKVLNRWFIQQPPAEAHRNRVQYLTQALTTETLRALRRGRKLRVLNVGCGPAGEIQAFLAETEASIHADFTLLDFNQETLDVAKTVLEAARARHQRRTRMQFVRKSVVQLIKSSARAGAGPESQYDLVYCAGLFDYLQDAVCRQLLKLFYEMVAPEGLLIVTNVDPSNPIRHWLGYILEWHLIYRNGRQMLALRPAAADADDSRVLSDLTGVNVFLEVRKPLA